MRIGVKGHFEHLLNDILNDGGSGGGAGEGVVRPNPPPEGLGAGLTAANLEDVRHFLEAFVVRSLLPSLEARVRALNHQARTPGPAPAEFLTTFLYHVDFSCHRSFPCFVLAQLSFSGCKLAGWAL
jgi:hypothetical protein